MRNTSGKPTARAIPVRETETELEAVRDKCIHLFTNSGLKRKDITAAGGPTSGTISKWLYRETRFPRYTTIASFLEALGCKLTVADRRTKEPEKEPVSLPQKRPKMPKRRPRKYIRNSLR